MTCAPDFATFRLLDALVGWDTDVVQGLAGVDSRSGISLASTFQGVDSASIAQALPPANLARGCGPCEWYLVTSCPPRSRLLRLDPCAADFRPLQGSCDPEALRCATAVAVHCDCIAVADPGAHCVWIWRRHGAELAAHIPMWAPGPIAWAPWGEWLVADLGALRLHRYDPTGRERAESVPIPGTAERVAVDAECNVWLVTNEEQVYRVWRWARGESRFVPQSLEVLLAAFPDSGVRQPFERWFCIEDRSPGGTVRRRCFDSYGRTGTPPSAGTPKPIYEQKGQLLTLAIDSGMPRTRWHRVRIDADIPVGTDLSVAVSAQEDATPVAQGAVDDPAWQDFAPGVPHSSDWQVGPHGALDFALTQPPGRYLFVRVRMTGDGLHTPVLRRIRLDFPRRTSLDSLPGVYRENPKAEAFSERFLAIFDAAVEDIDRAIERHPALLDVGAVPDEVLPWLGSFLDVAMDPAWTPERRRAVLKAVPDLYPLRGTVQGLRRTLQLLFDFDASIEELGLTRPWGSVGQTRLDGLRLFGRSQSRVRLGRSALSRTPVWSVGDPNLDALNAGAFRFRVLVAQFESDQQREQVIRVVESQKPAHTVATVQGGSGGFLMGQGVHVGVDTALVSLPPPVLGSGRGVRLSRNAVLWNNRRCTDAAFRIGRHSAIGINTVME